MNLKIMLLTLLLILVALALTPSVGSLASVATYSRATDTFTKAAGTGTAYTATLSHGSIISSSVTVTLNASFSGSWSVTSNSSTSTVGFTGMNNPTSYVITISYEYPGSGPTVALLDLVPVFWVVGVLGSGTGAVYAELRSDTQEK
jgi:hypothetical protein